MTHHEKESLGRREASPASRAHHTPRPFWRCLLSAVPVIVVVSLFTFILTHLGFLRSFETAALDTYLRLKPPQRPSHVVIVGINECDYRDLFNASSPLDPEKLGAIIAAVAAAQPRVIAIDIDTSHPLFKTLRRDEQWPLVVWARGAIAAGTRTQGDSPRGAGLEGVAAPARNCDQSVESLLEGPATSGGASLAPIGVLGGAADNVVRSGLALLPRDSDGVVRMYVRGFETTAGWLDTFPWAVVKAYRREASPEPEADREPLVLNFAGDRFAFPRISAGDVLKVASAEGWRRASPLKDKIVLVGGLFRAARDEYVTPVGPMAGVELVAQAIESELGGGGIRTANEVGMLVIELLGGILLVWLHHRFRVGIALVLSVLVIPLLSVLGSYAAFSSVARWASFAPLLVAVLVHQLYDHAREYRRLYVLASGLSPNHQG